MRVAFFDARSHDQQFFDQWNQEQNLGHELHYFETQLSEKTVPLAAGFPAVCSFVNDRLNETVLRELSKNGTKLVALRSAGFNHVDLNAAAQFGLIVTRVPSYSPYSVAEFAVALLLSLNRKIHRAYTRVREFNFSISGFMGFDLNGKTIGVIGCGSIGKKFAQIMGRGFGCRVLGYDLQRDPELQNESYFEYKELEEVLQQSDALSLHVPLSPSTRHLIDANCVRKMKKGVLLINTGRGALIDTVALIAALKSGKVGGAALDVYEEEESLFFEDHSEEIIQDDLLVRLTSFPNVIMTSHQGFFTNEALTDIAASVLSSISAFENGQEVEDLVKIRKQTSLQSPVRDS